MDTHVRDNLTFLFVDYVTALPGSPFDGQRVVLVDSLTDPTFSWQFRYISAKTSNKWVFLGGQPAIGNVTTLETTASASYVDLTTVGPSITIPVAGTYYAVFGAQVSGASQLGGYVGLKVGAAAVASTAEFVTGQASGSNQPAAVTGSASITAAASDVLKLQYHRNGAAGTAEFNNRWLHVLPRAIGG